MHFINSNSQNNIFVSIWLFSLTIMTFLIIIIGGLTRLTDSGLSMVDWRPLLGTIPPLNEASWQEVFNQYKLTPEYKIVNKSIDLDYFKYIFWWEWFHRFFARMIGIVFVVPLIFFLIKKQISKNLFIILMIVLLFGFFQAFIGWWMVKSGLVNDPYVSAYRLTFHLSNALIIFSILFWITLSSYYGKNNKVTEKYINNFFHLSLFFIFITIISGGFMAGTHAGNSYNTYPLMNEEIFPEGYFLKDNYLKNLFENTIAINFNHRWLATFTFIFILTFSLYFLISNKYEIKKISLIIILFFVFAQFLLGILTLIYNVPIILASMHQTNSTLLLASVLYAYHRHKYLNLNYP